MLILLVLTVLLSGLPISRPAIPAIQVRWPTFKGAYFEVQYPPGFKARKSLPSNSFEGKHDSAFFTATDGSVEFYVFSPLWNGKPEDIEPDLRSEEIVSQDVNGNGHLKVRRVTVKAKDNSYLRSFEDTENTETNNRRVFGIKYKDRNTYEKYREQYLIFKKSLKQFSD